MRELISPSDQQIRKPGKLNRVGVAATLALALAACGGNPNATKSPEITPNTETQSPIVLNITPRPSEAAGTPTTPEITPAPSASAEAEPESFGLEKGSVFVAQPGDIVSGDIAMSNTMESAILPLYDQDERKADGVEDTTKTALFVVVEAPGVIHSAYGGFVIRGLSAEKKAEVLKLWAVEKSRAGYVPDTVTWTGYESTVDQAGYTADGTQEVNPNMGYDDLVGNSEQLDNQAKIRTVLKLFANGTIDPDSEEGKVLMDILVNCLCACDKPEASPTPKPSEKPEDCPPKGFVDHIYNPGKEKSFSVTTNGLVVRGDVYINGKRHFDNNENTMAINYSWTESPRTYKITGKYAADVLWTCPVSTQEERAVWEEQLNIALQEEKDDPRSLDPKSLQKGK